MQFQGLTVTYPSPKGKRNKYFNQLRPGKKKKKKKNLITTTTKRGKIIKKKGKASPLERLMG